MFPVHAAKPTRIDIRRSIQVPDPVKLARYEKNPDLGPGILFFSGGTALRETSRLLIRYTHNSIHIITPFDSGGSSAELRKAFLMPAVGDIRNRLMALADLSFKGNPEIYNLFSHRFPKNKEKTVLYAELTRMASGKHPLVAQLSDPMRKIIRNHLQDFLEQMPDGFNLKGASIGNIILTAGYIAHRRQFDPVIYLFSQLVHVRGIVRPVVNKYRHLVSELEDGTRLVGQHLICGKENAEIRSPIKAVYLSENEADPVPAEVPIRNKMRDLIARAELICYPMGSFYSSILASLMPRGIGKSVSRTVCPKIFIPNTTRDPETFGHDLADQVDLLLEFLKKDDPGITPEQVIDFILIDRKNGKYPGGIDERRIRNAGIRIIDYPLVTPRTAPLIDERRLVPFLLSLT